MPAPSLPPRKGRGALTSASGRFERFTSHVFDDGWTTADPPLEPLLTTVQREAAKSLIQRNNSPDIRFEQSINPYRGCEHGCIYCFARPNHAYVGLSPGLDFETKLFAKMEAPRLLAQELGAKNYRPRPIVIGAATDPYQPIERRFQLTRQLLQVMLSWRHPVALVTKSHLVTRDIDLLAALAERNLARVAVSITTLDRSLARIMEPRAATPARRLDAIEALAKAGVPVTVMTAPIIPAINDHEIEALLAAAAAAGATGAGYVLLRLPREIETLFLEWLEAHFPDRSERVVSILRQCHAGRLYQSDWGVRQRGQGVFARLVAQRFRAASRRHKLDAPQPLLSTAHFRRPREPSDQPSFLTDLAPDD